MPEAPRLKKLIGPSFIILGLGLGSGEVVLWPYMSSTYGLGIVWGMLIGITMQFFINMEVERYALVNGESIFVGFARLLKWLPAWFIISTFLGFGWPGIGLYGATLLSEAFNIGSPNTVAIILFVAIGLILTLGKVLYKTVERLQMFIISIGVPLIVLLTAYLASKADLMELFRGLIGRGVHEGEAFSFLPNGIVIGTFLGALAYAGAGGNLNLTQSCYVRDKGYGMGKYATRITSLFSKKGKKQAVTLTGNTFPQTEENINRFHKWWKTVNLEHFLIFWGLGLFTMLTLSLLAYITTYESDAGGGIAFVITEGMAIGQLTLPIIGVLFLVVTGIMLAATQLTVLDSTSRIITENVLLMSKKETHNVSKTYYIVLWIQILFGITVFSIGFDQPLTLIIMGAIINAFSMFVYSGIILILNNKLLAKAVRPRMWRNVVMAATFLFLGYFCAITLLEKIG
ncbi:MAG: Nramp family divalent metal transporter [Candidatus Peribacteraceae bacterium]|nr:Nramp family divalent metal transporter [Candidatus Peribacteraceae bacterium]